MAHDCPLCRTRHGDRYLCDPARDLLNTMAARAEGYNMPTIELDEPIEAPPTLGDLHKPGGDRLMLQLVVNAALIPAGPGTNHPALVFTGTDVAGQPLPQWILPGTDADLRRVAQLVADMTELAIARAT